MNKLDLIISDSVIKLKNDLAIGLDYWLSFSQDNYILIGLTSGLSFTLSFLIKNRFFKTSSIITCFFSFIAQPFLYFTLPILSLELWEKEYLLLPKYLYAYLVSFVISGMASFFIFRYTFSFLDILKDRVTIKTSLQRNSNTDIRYLDHVIPSKKKNYSVKKYFKKGHIFVGRNEKNKPIYIPATKWFSSHVQVVGTTGSGKGVVVTYCLVQASIILGEFVSSVDPKSDEWQPHVLGSISDLYNINYYYIDLGGDIGQWNPFVNKSSMQIEELLVAAFGLSEKGTDADFYRVNDRKAARIFAKFIVNTDFTKKRLLELVAQFFIKHAELLETAPKFRDDLEELTSLPVVNVRNGLNIDQAIQRGDIIYVRGSMRNPRILKLQKMYVLSIMQSCESRDRENARHVCIFLDEFKYLISKPALEALGAIRDKCAHVILAHQSLGDLRDCPKDIDPESVVSSINENCSLKLTYKVNDPNTADWLARMSGKILVDDEIRHLETGSALTEQKSTERSLRQAERCLVDTNMLQSLPSLCAVLYGDEQAKFIFTSPYKVKKDSRWTTPTVFEGAFQNDDSNYKPSGSISEDLLDVD